MFHGFYNLTSGMITQNRKLNVVSNNLANLTTPGFKSDTQTSTTFQEEMLYRTGNQDRSVYTQLGPTNRIRIPDQTHTDFSDGDFMETGSPLDFAINGGGFFKVETEEGIAYTRNGSFYIDEDSCLALKGAGRVQGTGGEIELETDRIWVDAAGTIYDENGQEVDSLEIVDFENYDAMTKLPNGLFTAGGEEVEIEEPSILHKMIEKSNVSPVKAMEDMITSQRSLQGDAQLLRIYDQLMAKATNDIGRM